MAKLNAHIHSFNVGEASKAALARVDKERVRLHAERQENLFPYVIGKAIMRPGTQFINETAFQRSRLIPFSKTLEAQALLEISETSGNVGVLRVYIDDELIERPSVSTTVGDDDFSSSSSWTTTDTTDGASASFAGAKLKLDVDAKGAKAVCKQEVTVASADQNVLHALDIDVSNGPVTFFVGSSDGDDDYIRRTNLETGAHSLAFTPTGSSFWIRFESKLPREILVNRCAVESSGAMELSGSWDAEGLKQIRHEQSLDVIFLAFDNGAKPQQIKRRGDNSWSVVNYDGEGGPFTVARTADVRMTPSVTRGNGTLTASDDFFVSGHDGALFELTHSNSNFTQQLAAVDEVTKAFRVTGLTNSSTGISDREFKIHVSGTWIGFLQIERSFDSEFSGFDPFQSVITSNGTTTIDDEDDNAIVWYRVRMTGYTSGSAVIRSEYTGYGFTGICRVTSIASTTSANIEVLKDFSDTESTEFWKEGDWSDRRGYPTAVRLFDGRLWWAREDRFWGSLSDGFYTFDVGEADDSDSVQRNISTGGAFARVHWMMPLQRLVFGTEGSESSARSSSFDAPLTPSNITIKDASNQGVADIMPVKIDSRGVFIQRSKEEIYEIFYNIEASDYVTRSLMRFHEEIGWSSDPDNDDDGFIELAVQRQPETYIWCVKEDGQVICMLYEPSDEVFGWFRFITGANKATSGTRKDKIISVTVLPGAEEDSVYIMSERQNDDSSSFDGNFSKYTIEKLRFHKEAVSVSTEINSRGIPYRKYGNGLYMLDSFSEFTAAGTGGGETFSIPAHLEFKDITRAIGYPQGESQPRLLDTTLLRPGSTSAFDEITINETLQAGTTVIVGLPYEGYFLSSRLAYGAQGGTALLQAKRVPQVGLLLTNTHPNAIEIGSDYDDSEAMNKLPRMRDGVRVKDSDFWQEFDEEAFPFGGSWNTDSRVHIKVNAGHSATLNGLVVGVDTHEK